MTKKRCFFFSFIFLVVLLFLFRAWIFRAVVKYKIIDHRPSISLSDDLLLKYIDSETGRRPLTLQRIAEAAGKITTRELAFSASVSLTNPNLTLRQGQTNCIGYSAAFNSICQYLIERDQLQDQFRSTHLVGQLKLFDNNLHQFFQDPFWANHDFNLLEDLQTGEKIYSDPTLNDYLGIDRVEEE